LQKQGKLLLQCLQVSANQPTVALHGPEAFCAALAEHQPTLPNMLLELCGSRIAGPGRRAAEATELLLPAACSDDAGVASWLAYLA